MDRGDSRMKSRDRDKHEKLKFFYGFGGEKVAFLVSCANTIGDYIGG
jgi:hypothetical protein